jgi:hypothetical protein
MRRTRGQRRGCGERGQATVEWIGILLLVALVLAALPRLAPSADGHALATTLAHSITAPKSQITAPRSQVVGIRGGKRTEYPPPAGEAFTAPPLVPVPRPTTHRPARIPPTLRVRLPARPALLRRARRATGSAWRRAWYACLVYERFRWAFLHPESRFPGYTMPPEEVLRIANDCISPVDLVRDWSMFQQELGRPPR